MSFHKREPGSPRSVLDKEGSGRHTKGVLPAALAAVGGFAAALFHHRQRRQAVEELVPASSSGRLSEVEVMRALAPQGQGQCIVRNASGRQGEMVPYDQQQLQLQQQYALQQRTGGEPLTPRGSLPSPRVLYSAGPSPQRVAAFASPGAANNMVRCVSNLMYSENRKSRFHAQMFSLMSLAADTDTSSTGAQHLHRRTASATACRPRAGAYVSERLWRLASA